MKSYSFYITFGVSGMTKTHTLTSAYILGLKDLPGKEVGGLKINKYKFYIPKMLQRESAESSFIQSYCSLKRLDGSMVPTELEIFVGSTSLLLYQSYTG